MGFANAYIVLFQGDNAAYGVTSTSDERFANLGLSFVSMFRGSTGGGLDLIWRGDSQYPNGATSNGIFPIGNTQLYNLQLVLFVLFTLICNVLLLNLLIALMSAVFATVSEKASAQYRMDKTMLMIGLEGQFLRRPLQVTSERWLHIVAPKESPFWEKEGTVMDRLRDHVREGFGKVNTEMKELRVDVEAKLHAIQQAVDKLSPARENAVCAVCIVAALEQ